MATDKESLDKLIDRITPENQHIPERSPEPSVEHQELLDRLRAMVADRGETWDLSDKDQKAIAYALYLLGKKAVRESGSVGESPATSLVVAAKRVLEAFRAGRNPTFEELDKLETLLAGEELRANATQRT